MSSNPQAQRTHLEQLYISRPGASFFSTIRSASVINKLQMQNEKLILAHVRATSISRLHIQFDRYVTIRKSTPYLLKNNGVDNQFDCYKTKIRSKGVIMNNYGNPPPLHSFDLFFSFFLEIGRLQNHKHTHHTTTTYLNRINDSSLNIYIYMITGKLG